MISSNDLPTKFLVFWLLKYIHLSSSRVVTGALRRRRYALDTHGGRSDTDDDRMFSPALHWYPTILATGSCCEGIL